MKAIKGSFEIKSTPVPPTELLKKMNGLSMTFEKTFRGELDGHSSVSMMGTMNKDLGSGGYVALELFEGRLDGKSGSFVLQHSSLMDKGKDSQSIKVVPDSATGDLKGLNGEMRIEIKEGKHFYSFEYSL